jgi:hypothetical protein
MKQKIIPSTDSRMHKYLTISLALKICQLFPHSVLTERGKMCGPVAFQLESPNWREWKAILPCQLRKRCWFVTRGQLAQISNFSPPCLSWLYYTWFALACSFCLPRKIKQHFFSTLNISDLNFCTYSFLTLLFYLASYRLCITGKYYWKFQVYTNSTRAMNNDVSIELGKLRL